MASSAKIPTRPAQTTSNPREEDKKAHSKPKDLSHVPCKFFRLGQCTAGDACPFSHALAPPGQPKQVCQWFIQGNCRFAHKCALAHVLPGEPMTMDRKNKKAAQQQAQQTGTGGDRERERDKDRRDRPGDAGKREKSAKRPGGSKSSNGRGDPNGGQDSTSSRGDGSPMISSVATLRPPIRFGKGSTTPAVLKDTTAVSSPPVGDVDVDRRWATTSLEQIAHQPRQSTATPTPAAEPAALSDYSKTPSATIADLPIPQQPTVGTPPILTKKIPVAVASPSIPQRSPLSRTHEPRSSADLGGSMAGTGVDNTGARFGPVGSPPRNGALSAESNSASRGNLSSLFAALSANPQGGVYPNPQSQNTQQALEPIDAHTQDPEPSSINSQSNLHAHMKLSTLGTSPFSMPGSRSLFMPYDPLSSSANSQSHMPTYLSAGGVPASFAGSRAPGWGTGMEPRRPSFPGHNARPSLSSNSIRSNDVLDESALEEEEDGAEEFLPSSLNNLLTKEERARKLSRSGGNRPTRDSLRKLDDEGDEDGWDATIRHRRQPMQAGKPTESGGNMFSRSVPATGLLGNVRSLWTANQLGNPPLEEGAFGTTPNQQQDLYSLMSASGYGPSPSMLSSSAASNASNAFLKSGRGMYTGDRLGNGDIMGQPNDLQAGSFTNGQTGMYNKGGSQTGQHQHHSSLSGMPTSSRPIIPHAHSHSHSQSQNLPAPAGYGMYAGPAELSSVNTLDGPARFYGQARRPPPVAAAEPTGEPRHQPGQSLPRGLGAGLSRLHFVPAVSLSSSGMGTPATPSAFLTSPPPFATTFNDLAPVPEPGRPQSSTLTARLAAAGVGNAGAKLSEQQVMNTGMQANEESQYTGMMGSALNLHNVRRNGSPWGSGPARPFSGGLADDVDVDEGTLFSN